MRCGRPRNAVPGMGNPSNKYPKKTFHALWQILQGAFLFDKSRTGFNSVEDSPKVTEPGGKEQDVGRRGSKVLVSLVSLWLQLVARLGTGQSTEVWCSPVSSGERVPLGVNTGQGRGLFEVRGGARTGKGQ